jgi:hypothetical protein
VVAPLLGGPTRGVLRGPFTLRKSKPHRYHRCVRITVVVLGVLLVLAGAVWTAQGLNLPWAPSSFMTADRTWVLIGVVTVVAGFVLVGWGRKGG